MRRITVLAALLCLVSIPAFAQHRGFGRGFGGGFRPGFGHGFGGFRPGFRHFGGFHGGVRVFGGFHRGFGFHSRVFVRPRPFFGSFFYSAPLFYGGFGYAGDFGYPYVPPPPPPNVVIVVPPPPSYYDDYEDRRPREIVRREPEPGGAISYPPEQVYFSLALKDGTVETGIAYWVEGDTLHYLTRAGRHRQVPLASVDRARSEQLNRGGAIEFRLPPE